MDRFVQYVLPYVPGCLDSLIKTHVLLAANEFCRKSFCLRETVTETATAAIEELYVVPYTPEVDIVDIEVRVNSLPVTTYSFSGNYVSFESPLSTGDTAKILTFLAPSRDATALPDELYTSWLEGIAAGARASLMRMPKKDWTNPQLAMVEQKTFLHQIGQASVMSRRKNTQATNRIQMRPWA